MGVIMIFFHSVRCSTHGCGASHCLGSSLTAAWKFLSFGFSEIHSGKCVGALPTAGNGAL